jgi:hypothetical protein
MGMMLAAAPALAPDVPRRGNNSFDMLATDNCHPSGG